VEALRADDREAWRDWLVRNHGTEKEVWLTLYKKNSGRRGVSYDAAVEEALCFGWIDSAIRGVDGESYAQKFTPRKPGSRWSDSNRARMRRLIDEGRMTEAGLAAYRSAGDEPTPDRGARSTK
jgi:uncharacterized protein YdeI (YjbR/CyaY-like superfamily)